MDRISLRDILHTDADHKRQQAEQRLRQSAGDPYQAERARREQLEAIQIEGLARDILAWLEQGDG